MRACFRFPECSISYTKILQGESNGKEGNAVLPDLTLPNRSISYTKILQTRGMRACFQFPECSISYTKILQGESNGKEGNAVLPDLTLPNRSISYTKI